jgi:hypothetical protein
MHQLRARLFGTMMGTRGLASAPAQVQWMRRTAGFCDKDDAGLFVMPGPFVQVWNPRPLSSQVSFAMMAERRNLMDEVLFAFFPGTTHTFPETFSWLLHHTFWP